MTFRSTFAALLLGTAALPAAAQTPVYPPTAPVYPPPSAAPQQPAGQPAAPPPAAMRPAFNRLELTAIAGYQVNTNVDTSVGELDVGDAPVYGAAIGVMARPGSRAELLWLYSDPTVKPLLPGGTSFNVATHYFQLGGTQSIRRGKLEPFGGATLGAAWFIPDASTAVGGATTYQLDDVWRFAFTLGLGVKVHLSPSLLLRLEAKLAAPVYFSGGGFYFGTGGGGATVSGGIPVWQWNFLGGLAFGK